MSTRRAHEAAWGIPRPGDVIGGKYVVESPCGRGGLAIVLTALHADLDRKVAIKVLLPEWAGDAGVVERFLTEGRTATRITSEHVARVFDVGTIDGGAPYLVLEHLEGHDLQDVVSAWGPLPVPTAVDWVLQATEAVGEAHAQGVIHRDIKPANLFLTHRADGSACIKVIDFGLSSVVAPWSAEGGRHAALDADVMGSPSYMAPEQIRSSCLADERADVWSLGAVLHELITGQPPFQGSTVPGVCAAVLTKPPPPISSLRANVPLALERAVLQCLQKDPAARFANVADMARAVAPSGTSIARTSCERIDRILSDGARPGDDLAPVPAPAEHLPGGPPLFFDDATYADAVPDEPDDDWIAHRRVFRAHASARTVLGAILVMSGLGTAALLGLYASVHDADPPPRAQTPATAPTTDLAPAPAPATATAPPTLASATDPAPAPPTPAPAPPTLASATDLAPAPAPTPATAPATTPAPALAHAPPKPRRLPRPAPTLHLPSPVPAPAAQIEPDAPPPPAPPEPAAPPAPRSADDLFDGRK